MLTKKIRFKQDDGSPFPDWQECRLGALCKIAKRGGTPRSTVKEYYNGDIPFLTIRDLTSQGKYITSTSKTITKKGLDSSASWIVPANAIIYSLNASVGFVSINKIPVATSDAMASLIIKNDTDIEYIYYCLFHFKQYIHKFTKTGTQSNLDIQTVKGITINLPCLEEQKKIGSFLQNIDKKISLLEQQTTLTQQYKKGILQKMLTKKYDLSKTMALTFLTGKR